jgi:hypothetical protein
MIKKYVNFITESESSEKISQDKFNDIKDEVKKMIENTIKKQGGEFNSFIDELLKENSDSKIEGLINDSDTYDFFLKWKNEIDEILNSVKYFDEVPANNNIFGIYEFTIKGTEKAVKEVIKMLK